MPKKPTKNKTPDLPGIAGKGVSPLVIPSIAKLVDKYERQKEKRCQASPGEITAKRELSAALHDNRAALPVNEDGQSFYRHEGVDYILEENLKRRAADEAEDGGAE